MSRVLTGQNGGSRPNKKEKQWGKVIYVHEHRDWGTTKRGGKPQGTDEQGKRGEKRPKIRKKHRNHSICVGVIKFDLEVLHLWSKKSRRDHISTEKGPGSIHNSRKMVLVR